MHLAEAIYSLGSVDGSEYLYIYHMTFGHGVPGLLPLHLVPCDMDTQVHSILSNKLPLRSIKIPARAYTSAASSCSGNLQTSSISD